MKIEDVIQQREFRNEYQRMMINVLYSGNWMNYQIGSVLKPFGLSLQQYNVLRILRAQHPKPISVRLIIDRMLDQMSNASRLVEKLRQKGLVKRQQSPNDRRQVDIIITQKGLKLLDKIQKPMISFEEKLKTISQKEAEQINELLDKLRQEVKN